MNMVPNVDWCETLGSLEWAMGSLSLEAEKAPREQQKGRSLAGSGL